MATHESNYTSEIISELYDIDEQSEITFPLSFKLIDSYHQEDPCL